MSARMPECQKFVVTCEIKHGKSFKIISAFYFTCNDVRNWNSTISAVERVQKLFQRYWSCWKIFTSCNKPVK